MPTREQVKELLPVLVAYVDGKAIQLKHSGNWLDVAANTELSFNNDPATYRIKPEPVTRVRPFTLDEFRAKVLRIVFAKPKMEACWQRIEDVDWGDISKLVFIGTSWLSLDSLASHWMIVNPDGSESPFGVVEEVT